MTPSLILDHAFVKNLVKMVDVVFGLVTKLYLTLL